jgi:hypothetical protein
VLAASSFCIFIWPLQDEDTLKKGKKQSTAPKRAAPASTHFLLHSFCICVAYAGGGDADKGQEACTKATTLSLLAANLCVFVVAAGGGDAKEGQEACRTKTRCVNQHSLLPASSFCVFIWPLQEDETPKKGKKRAA